MVPFFLGSLLEPPLVSQIVTHYPKIRENVVNINYIKTAKGWMILGCVDFGLWSDSGCRQDGHIQDVMPFNLSLRVWPIGNVVSSVKWESLLTPVLMCMPNRCCFYCSYSISLYSNAVFP